MKKLYFGIVIVVIAFVFILYFSRSANSPTTIIPNESSVVSTVFLTPAPSSIKMKVPFTSQSPFGDWKDPRQQDGCEEASVLMAMRWVQGRGLTKEEALAEILAIADFEEKKYGNFHDTDARDTVERIFKEYYKYDNVTAISGISVEDIKVEIVKGHLVLVPLNGRMLDNPYFSGDGPDRHMLVILGYDAKKDEFITNDPGTRKGEGYRYKSAIMQRSLLDYPTGDHLPVVEHRTAMIVVKK